MQTILFSSLLALDCSSTRDILEYNGHYYTITTDKLTFDVAKQVAENNGGYLAIPNTTTENGFIKGLIGGSTAWIGVWDPNYSSSYCYEGSGTCSTNPSRYRTVKNQTLTYSNWDVNQPDNFVREYDIVDNMAMVAPLGEHWGVMSGNSGRWADYGLHADSFNNPAMFIAVFEYDTKPECFMQDGALSADNFTAKKCNTSVWDETADVLTPGQTFNCLVDQYGTDYCPEALAPADTYWDYSDAYSVAQTGSVVDYVAKAGCPIGTTLNTATGLCYDGGSLNKNWGAADSLCVAKGMRLPTVYETSAMVAGGIPPYNVFTWTSATLMPGTHVQWSSASVSVGSAADFITISARCVSTLACPTGYTDNGTNCKKTVNYTYYNYLCSTGTAINAGGNCAKTDPNLTLNNTSTLDDPCNSLTPPPDNCKALKYTCNSTVREPVWIDNKWQCSPFPCIGESDVENLDASVGASDTDNGGWNENGGCDGQIYLFSGKGEKCRSWDMFFGLAGGGCCDKDKVFAGLVECKANEKLLAEKNRAEQCHYVGDFCSKKIKLGFIKICVQKSKGHCCFNSKLARILQEQGRPQLNIGWGSGENPQCRGFTPEEFQKLDISKMDLNEVFEDIKLNAINIITVTDNIKNKVKDINK